jgi:hypothetical protein
MGKLQHRRSFSVRGPTYYRLKAYCASHRIHVSAYVEALVAGAMDAVGEPAPTSAPDGYPTRRLTGSEKMARDLAKQPPAHFTF